MISSTYRVNLERRILYEMDKCSHFKEVRASMHAGKQLMRTETFIKVENDTS
jgi:hypothetical protein